MVATQELSPRITLRQPDLIDRERLASRKGLRARREISISSLFRPVNGGLLISIKVKDGLRGRSDGGDGLSLIESDVASDLSNFVAEHDLKFYPVFDLGEARLHALEDRAAENSRTAQPVLEGFFYVKLPGGSSIDQAYEIAVALNDHPAVEFTSIQEAARAAVVTDNGPSTTSLRDLQSWRGLASVTGGAGIDYAWSFQGRGEGGRIIDVENGYLPTHADLLGPPIFDYTDGTFSVSDRSVNHGTAALGVLAGDDDCDGIVGAVPLSDRVGFVSTAGNGTTQYIINCPVDTPLEYAATSFSKAVLIATENLGFGDVLLYEVGRDINDDGILNGDIPIETEFLNFCATKLATDAGIIVVGGTGKGNYDLDSGNPADPDYETNEASMAQHEWREMGDSGAIIVGAGSSDTQHNKLDFSSYGSRVDVQAWGENVYTSGDDESAPTSNGYRNFSGTSSASAVVAATVASVQSVMRVQTSIGEFDSVSMRLLLNTTGRPQGLGGATPGAIGPAVDAEAAITAVTPIITPTVVKDSTLPIIDDPSYEYIETFRVEIKRAGGEPTITPGAESALARIVDNDQASTGLVNFTRAGRYFIPALGNPIGNPSGPAPIPLTVSGLDGEISEVVVRISDFSHSAYVAPDIFLESPEGDFCKLVSDLNLTGAATNTENVDLTFTDSGAAQSTNELLTTGVYRPYDFNSGIPDTLLDGTQPNAPPFLSAFDGEDPNGTWKLHIVEIGIGDARGIREEEV